MGVENGKETLIDREPKRLTSKEINYLDNELARYGFTKMIQNTFHELKDSATIILKNRMFYFREGVGDDPVSYDYRISLQKKNERIEVEGDGRNNVDHLPLARTRSGYINGGEHGFVLRKDNKIFARFAFISEFVSYAGSR